MLTPANKARMWNERFDYVLSFVKDKKKYESLSEMKSYIKEKMFRESKTPVEIENWVKRNVPLYGYDNIKMMLMTMNTNIVSINDEFQQYVVEDDEELGNSCTCNRADDFCAYGYDCTSTSCDYKSSGCGWFWMGPCNGNCIRR